MVKVAVLGYGNIGSGVVQVLLREKEEIRRRTGEEIVPALVLDLRTFPGDIMEDKVVNDINIILNDPEIKVVVETMGGTRPAFAFVKSCLEAGKHVATSNKELVAAHGPELLRTAKEHGVQFLFEASVGGAIPVIRPLSTCVTADKITEVTGILNGTTNFMLTSMAEEGCAYEDILKKAQELGYAERNPAADVEGHDACRKIAILSSLAFGKWVDYQDIPTEGITAITALDFSYAKAFGMSIKLFGSSHIEEDGIFARVSPVMIASDHPLFHVNGVMNAILVRAEMTGDLMFYGAGAGKLPTASAVAADVVAAVKNPAGREIDLFPEEKQIVLPAEKEVCSWFIRTTDTAADEIAARVDAKKINKDIHAGEAGMITKPMTEKEVKAAAGSGLIAAIRVAD